MISISTQTLVRALVAGAIVAAPLTAVAVSAQADGVPLTTDQSATEQGSIGQDVARPGRPAPAPRGHLPGPGIGPHLQGPRPDFRGPHFPRHNRFLPPLGDVFPGDFGSF